jgi:hypothetical protein
MAKPAHRPPHEPTAKDRTLVQVMIAGGIEQNNIARSLGISRPTLRKYYAKEIASAAHEANAKVVAALYSNATAGKNVVAQIWWTKTRMGWKEIQTVETVGKDGRPIEQVVTYRWAEAVKGP